MPVAAGGDDQQFVFIDRLRVKGGIVDLAFYKAEVDFSGSGHFGDRIGVADVQRDYDAGITAMECGDAGRRPVAADRLAGGDRRSAGLEAGKIGEGLFGRRGARHTALASARKARPAPVSAMRRPMRSNNLTPCRSSSAAMRRWSPTG